MMLTSRIGLFTRDWMQVCNPVTSSSFQARLAIQARLFPGHEPRGGSGSELGGRDPFRIAWLGDVKPPSLPPLQGLHKGAIEPEDIGHLANHSSSALRMSAG